MKYIYSNWLYSIFEQKAEKYNKLINKYLDPRAGLSDEERIETWKHLKKIEQWYEIKSLPVQKEEIIIKTNYIPQKKYYDRHGFIGKKMDSENWKISEFMDSFGGKLLITY